MKEIRVKSFSELHECVQKYDQLSSIFRGVSNARYELIPKIGRKTLKLRGTDSLAKAEKRMLALFKERCVSYLELTPRNEWEWLAVAQHHGLATRLLDWTRNSLVGAYFAVRKKVDADAAMYVWTNKNKQINPDKETDPFQIDKVRKYIPAHFTQRIIAQTGLFSVHPNPQEAMQSSDIEKIVIVKDFRKPLKDILFRYGVHEFSVFPDLDSLAKHITWLRTESH